MRIKKRDICMHLFSIYNLDFMKFMNNQYNLSLNKKNK